jgi:hypothetical protein
MNRPKPRLVKFSMIACAVAAGFVATDAHGATVLITPTGVTSPTPAYQGVRVAGHLIDNSGMSAPITISNYLTDNANANTNTTSSNTWVTASTPTPTSPAVMTFTFGQVYNVTDLLVWEYVFTSLTPKDVTLDFSTDGGTTWASSVNLTMHDNTGGASTNGTRPVNDTSLGGSHAANAVRMTITSDYANNLAALDELRFLGSNVVAAPAPAALPAGGVLLGLIALRRRG